ncbi:unnamed protein product [Linum trigynum]|uniref:Uncharacterized protein n=1 Tax=Linum trigynum TaxID=586398 RepID=A0AAV2F7H9_9ROSI
MGKKLWPKEIAATSCSAPLPSNSAAELNHGEGSRSGGRRRSSLHRGWGLLLVKGREEEDMGRALDGLRLSPFGLERSGGRWPLVGEEKRTTKCGLERRAAACWLLGFASGLRE